MSNAWLQCEVTPGTLDGEVAILIRTIDGRALSFFLPADYVKVGSIAERGEISVQEVDGDANSSVVFLPRRTFEGTNVAKVPRAALNFA